MASVVEKRIRLGAETADRLGRLAAAKQVSEDQIVEQALDILFSLTESLEERAERQGWPLLSEAALRRVWDNDEDAAYDGWKETSRPILDEFCTTSALSPSVISRR